MDDMISGIRTSTGVTGAKNLGDVASDEQFSHIQLADISRNFVAESRDSELMFNWLFKWIDGGAVILSTFAAAWAASFFLTEREAMEQFAPDIIAVLAFFVMLRSR